LKGKYGCACAFTCNTMSWRGTDHFCLFSIAKHNFPIKLDLYYGYRSPNCSFSST
jgi:hypothetical protein